MKKKLQLSETQLIEFIENTVRRIKKERQSKVVKINENDLYKIVDKVAAEQKVVAKSKVKTPQINESKKPTKEEFIELRKKERRRKIFESANKGERKKNLNNKNNES